MLNKCLACGKPVKNKYCNVSCQNRHQQKNRKKSKYSLQKRSQTTKDKWRTFTVSCSICKKEIEIREFNVEKPKKEKYYCSRNCANTRHHSKETKEKISKSIKRKIKEGNPVGFIKKNLKLKELRIKICLKCNKEFETKNKNQKFCSKKCALIISGKNRCKKAHKKRKENPEWWSDICKKAYATGNNFVAGGTTKWYSYKDIKVQGTYELRTCKILDKWKETGKIKDWEYTKDRIKYIDEKGKSRNYLLDFKVFENNNGSFYYIETKGWERPNDKFKWYAVRNKGYKLIVWFNEEINKEEMVLKKGAYS